MKPSDKQRRKLMRDAAEDVCWGISNAIHFEMNDHDLAQFIRNDFKKWADLVDWETWS